MRDTLIQPGAVRQPLKYSGSLIGGSPRARYFDTTANSYLTRDTVPVSAAPLTMSCWFRARSLGAFQRLMQLTNPGTGTGNHAMFLLQVSSGTGTINVYTSTSSTVNESIVTTTGCTVNKWHHACGIWIDATNRYAFLDGASSAYGSTSLTPAGVSQANIGRLYWPVTPTSFYSDCEIAHAAIWNVNLMERDVRSLAIDRFYPSQVRPDRLVAYWPLGGHLSEATGDRDYIGTYDLTATSGPKWAQGPWLRSVVRRLPMPTVDLQLSGGPFPHHIRKKLSGGMGWRGC